MIALIEDTVSAQPCLILAHADAAYVAGACRSFRQLGWDVYTARTGPEARRLARMLGAELIVLDADLPEESGWLTCAKLVRQGPGARVVLVAADADPRGRSLAAFVGATGLVGRDEGPSALLRHARAPELPVAG